MAKLPPDLPPTLVVVVDTEEEFDWGKPFARHNTAVTSIAEQVRAQDIFARFGVRPTYVMDYPVATTEASIRVLDGFWRQGACDIGTHLHPWVNPPFEEPVNARNSYPGNLPPDLERRKLESLTSAIRANFGVQPIAYKAGRYGFGPATAGALEQLGYRIDLSVVPHTDFGADGGPDFRCVADRPFRFGSGSDMLAIPLSRGFAGAAASIGAGLYPLFDTALGRKLRIGGIAARSRILERITLTPEGIDHAAHRRLTRSLLARGHRVFSMTYHSSSLGIGHTPYVRNKEDRARFLSAIESYLAYFKDAVGGRFGTVFELYDLMMRNRPVAA
ncbi:MAG TPA: polysaccharide deacetylase family protein [Candidatus Cybelea sp.]|nr:polysaccharide deacetylase family protein [Candidatus Cybelea sp.]